MTTIEKNDRPPERQVAGLDKERRVTRSIRRNGLFWDNRELLAVFYLYVTLKDELTTPRNHPLIKSLAAAMERTDNAIAKRIQNYKSIDPSYPGRGLDKPGPYVRIWQRYEADPENVMDEARSAYQEYIVASELG